MKTEITKGTVIRLTITPEEAYWIKAVSQNYTGNYGEEGAKEAGIRASIFESLPSFDELAILLEEV